MIPFVSTRDARNLPRLQQLLDGAFTTAARLVGRTVVTNDVDEVLARGGDGVLEKYRFEPSITTVWEEAYTIAEGMLATITLEPEGVEWRRAMLGELASLLVRPLVAALVRAALTETTVAATARGLPGEGLFASLATGSAKLVADLSHGSPAIPHLRRRSAGPTTWLFMSGHAPSASVAGLLPLLEPGSTEVLVNRAYVGSAVLDEVRERGFSIQEVRWPRSLETGRFLTLYRALVEAFRATLGWLPTAPFAKPLATLARSWLVYVPPGGLRIPFAPGDRLVTGHDRNLMSSSLVIQARASGADTVTLQDGLFAPLRFMTDFPSDRIGVFGEHFREMYRRAGVAADRVEVIGNQRWMSYSARPRDDAERRALFGTDRRVAVFFGQYFPVSDLEMYDMLALCRDVIGRRDGWDLVVKPHPHYPLDHILAHLPGVRLAPAGASVLDLLKSADVALSRHSTTLIEAVLVGRRAGSIILNERIAHPLYADYDPIQIIRDGASLEALLDGADLDDATVDHFRARFVADADPEAARRLLGISDPPEARP